MRVRVVATTLAICAREVERGPLPRRSLLPARGLRSSRCRRCASGATTSRCSCATSCAIERRVGPRDARAPRRCGAARRHDWPGNVRELRNVRPPRGDPLRGRHRRTRARARARRRRQRRAPREPRRRRRARSRRPPPLPFRVRAQPRRRGSRRHARARRADVRGARTHDLPPGRSRRTGQPPARGARARHLALHVLRSREAARARSASRGARGGGVAGLSRHSSCAGFSAGAPAAPGAAGVGVGVGACGCWRRRRWRRRSGGLRGRRRWRCCSVAAARLIVLLLALVGVKRGVEEELGGVTLICVRVSMWMRKSPRPIPSASGCGLPKADRPA